MNPEAVDYLDIEIAVARFFGWRQNLVVPNISWGAGFSHEMDLAVLTPARHLTEVEIKTTVADLKRDLKKTGPYGTRQHPHKAPHPRIRRLFFAYPAAMDGDATRALVPEHAGILAIQRRWYGTSSEVIVTEIRPARTNKDAKAMTEAEAVNLHRLASMRVWTLKETLDQRFKREKNQRSKKKRLDIPAFDKID